MMIPPCRAAVKPVAMTIKDLGRWESLEMGQRVYSLGLLVGLRCTL